MHVANSVDQILRVNHAGERGAINIYRAQLLISNLFHQECVETLSEFLVHERRHFDTFDGLLRSRDIRPCHALGLWAMGGWVLGLITAAVGKRGIWVCTAAVESTVNAHLSHQIAFLTERDAEALAAVQSIRSDEEAHEHEATRNLGPLSVPYRLLWRLVAGSTAFAIWLSTRL